MFTLIFDIGKTNKKYFVFDNKFNIVERQEIVFDEIEDEDGFVCDDILKISTWIETVFSEVKKQYHITKVNFSTYGASFVHLNAKGKSITALYNYLKPFESDIKTIFFEKIGNEIDFSLETSSPFLGMLNSGLQLFWLKHSKPKLFEKIVTSLHFPQYCNYLLTGKANSEYTSIGCHTGLWNYKQKQYHKWVLNEKIDRKLAPIVNSDSVSIIKNIEIGVGIHDSSSALIPYLIGVKEKFILISTGTWSIVLNPFNSEELTLDELNQDCLQFMQTDGKPVKASRLFLGNELQEQLKLLNDYFHKDNNYYQNINLTQNIYKELKKQKLKTFSFKELNDNNLRNSSFKNFENFEIAYHQLMIEIVDRQIKAINLALGKSTEIETIFIDGGFTKNDLYCRMIAFELPEFNIKITQLASGSALGAAIMMNRKNFNSEIFNEILKVKSILI